MRAWWSKLKSVFAGRARASTDLREELEAHLAMQVEENRSRGMPEEQARRRRSPRLETPR